MNDDLDFGETIRGFRGGQKVFGRYELVRLLGQGGMGVVWLAKDGKLERQVALKFLPEVLAKDAEAVADLKRETRRALELTHPNIVRIYDFVEDARYAAISMEYVEGVSLSALKLEKPERHLEVAELKPWVEELCGALEYAHRKAKVAHRDLKPANLMIDESGALKVMDFGISATLSDTTTRVSRHAGSSGTPVYMSPQQIMGEKPSATDDVYSLGATLYELLTSKPPFYTGNILVQVREKEAPTMSARREEFGVNGGEIPVTWEETIKACLAKEASQRPQSMAEVWARLNGANVAPPPPPAPVPEKPQKLEDIPAGDKKAVRSPEPSPKRKRKLAGKLATTVLLLGPCLVCGISVILDWRKLYNDISHYDTLAKNFTELGVVGIIYSISVLIVGVFWVFKMRQAICWRRYDRMAMLAVPAAVFIICFSASLGDGTMSGVGLFSISLLALSLGAFFCMLFTWLGQRQGAVTPEARPPTETKKMKVVLAVISACVLLVAGMGYLWVAGTPAREGAEAQRRQRDYAGEAFTVPGVNMEMVPIPSGSFLMGSEYGWRAAPAHTVQITKSYWMGKHEVTQGQWEALMGSNPSHFKNAGSNGPVEKVSWEEAMEYCRKLTERERNTGRLPSGYEYTLPTEAEWEYACRAGTSGGYAGALSEMAWHEKNSGTTTHEVGQKRGNAWGLYDMHGNVWEWCRDWYEDYKAGEATDPTGPATGTGRVCRGGSWSRAADGCRSAVRNGYEPGFRYYFLGFRVALSSVGGR